MLCVQSSNVSKLAFASDDLIKVWIIQNTRFSPISWFSCRSRICSLTRFLNSNPFEFKNSSRCRKIISNKGSDYKTTSIKFFLVQNWDIWYQVVQKWRHGGHGSGGSIWPMQIFWWASVQGYTLFWIFNIKIFRFNEFWIEIILLINATEIQIAATNGMNEIPACGSYWK